MSQPTWKNPKINHRTGESIRAEIRSLASSYVPEWNYTEQQPDIGSTIAGIFAGQMEENVDLMNNIVERYHTEFINMLDLTLRPAIPARSIVVFRMVDDTVPGLGIAKGTRLQTDEDSDDATPIVYETDRSLYVTSANLSDMFLTDLEEGTMVPLLGSFDTPELYPGEREPAIGAAGSRAEQEENTDLVKPFSLFHAGKGIERNALSLYHTTAFDPEDGAVYLRFMGDPELVKDIAEGRIRISYLAEEGLQPVTDLEEVGDGATLIIKKHGECRKIAFEEGGEEQYSLFVLEATDPVRKIRKATSIGISSEGDPQPAHFVVGEVSELDPKRFLPFTDTMSLYSECYIGHDRYFSQKNAKITITFRATFGENLLDLTRAQEESELKIIKKVPKKVAETVPAMVHADEITLEYFNGIGWKRLKADQEYATWFEETESGEYRLTFRCPADWEESENGAYVGRALRMQLVRADNCYMRPAIHYYPIIQDLHVSYSYDGDFIEPDHVRMLYGTRVEDLSGRFGRDHGTPVFVPSEYTEDALYLGFDQKIDEGPVSIFFMVRDMQYHLPLKCRYEYSTDQGFRQMKVLDFTEDFAKSGVVMFDPPSDFREMTLEGKRRFWIRISRYQVERSDEQAQFLPSIDGILLNAIPVTNINTGGEEDYYLDEVGPDQSFNLTADKILSAQVWVNEKDSLVREKIEAMQLEHPERIRVERDLLGNITGVFVLWEEVSRFSDDAPRRSYILDRMDNRILFGDGIHQDIPRVIDDVAFRVQLSTSNGADGNVEVGRISSVTGEALFLDTISNPIRAFGGSNMETVPEALERGANILYSRNRLVSLEDYTRTILSYSGNIHRVNAVLGQTPDGKGSESDMSFVILMKDFLDGSYSFHMIAQNLKDYILERCELMISPDNIHIVEPIFVSLSVSVWMETNNLEETFEVQSKVREAMVDFLNPIGENGRGGWDIGVMPKRSQIMLRLNTLKGSASIKKLTLVASYTDYSGYHETDLESLEVSPFMVVRSGKHAIHVDYV
ncbi:MAG: hypothetical protein K6E81_03230 [Lachnospiraceae bacterium]|nr:hypothetical protein [Lachnospiraceae bacterium]